MEYWSIGVLECWSIGVVGQWGGWSGCFWVAALEDGEGTGDGGCQQCQQSSYAEAESPWRLVADFQDLRACGDMREHPPPIVG